MTTIDGVEYCDECDTFSGVHGCDDVRCRKPKVTAPDEKWVAIAHELVQEWNGKRHSDLAAAIAAKLAEVDRDARDEGKREGMRYGALLPGEIDPIERIADILGIMIDRDEVAALTALIAEVKAAERAACLDDCACEARDDGTAQRIEARIRGRAK